MGARGKCLINHMLPYTSYNNLFYVPVAHALLYGVVRSFARFIFKKVKDLSSLGVKKDYILTNTVRKVIQKRAPFMAVSTDFGRKYRDVIKHHNNYKIEDWLHFVETFSHYIFLPGTLTPRLEEMWSLLQKVVHHYCRGVSFTKSHGSTFKDQSDLAAEALRKYAVLVEENFPSSMCTYNLHMLVCRLPVQEQQRGSSAKDLELVVERNMQYFKQRIGKHNSKDPEKIFVGDLFLEKALRRVVRDHPNLPSYEAMCGDCGLVTFQGPTYDQLEEGSDTILLGKGMVPTADQIAQIKEAIKVYAKVVCMQRQWSGEALEKALRPPPRNSQPRLDKHVLVYRRAEVNQDVFISHWYHRVLRPSSYIQVYFEDSKSSFIGQVLFFVRIPLSKLTEDAVAPTTAASSCSLPEADDVSFLPRPNQDHFESVNAIRLAVVKFFKRKSLLPDTRCPDIDMETPKIQRFDPDDPVLHSGGMQCEGLEPSMITSKCVVTTQAPFYAIPYSQLTQTSRR